MKILHTADWHLGDFKGPKKDRFEDIVRSIDDLIAQAETLEPGVIIVAGDIFHKTQMWGDTMLKHVKVMADKLDRLADIARTYVMIGTANHDNSRAFDMLADLCRVEIVTEPSTWTFNDTGELTSITFIPPVDRKVFRSQNDVILTLEEENQAITELLKDVVLGESLEAEKADNKILVSHYTMVGAKSEQDHIFSTGDIMLPSDAVEASCYDLVCLGHIHKAQRIEGLIKDCYYSGNISAISFSEENDPKGFYIHDTNDKTAIFHRVWTREYLTLDFGLSVINDIDTLDDFLGWEATMSIQDKIVRVKYDSNEGIEKSINKKFIENWLYNKGAFHVQGIIPNKIIESTNKETLNDNGVLENLKIFLESNAVEPERIQLLTELARPIVEKIEADFSLEHMTGTLKPLSLHVENYRSYKNESFDFTKITKAVVQGANGLGKSSFFMDAILDCLYEEPREGTIDGWIDISEDVKKGVIEFSFSIGTNVYRVIRTRLKSGRATLSLQEKFVSDEIIDINEPNWTDISGEKMVETQLKIKNLLGMDVKTFKSCMLIMQDQYGLVLQADKKERMRIILNILGLDIYEKLQKKFSELRLDQAREIDKIDEFLNVNSDLIENHKLITEKITLAEDSIKYFDDSLKEKNDLLEETGNNIATLNKFKEVVSRKNQEITGHKKNIQLVSQKIEDNKLYLSENNFDLDKTKYESIVKDLADAGNKIEKRDLILESLRDTKKYLDETNLKISKGDTIISDLVSKIEAVEIQMKEVESINSFELNKELEEIKGTMIYLDQLKKEHVRLKEMVSKDTNKKEQNFSQSQSVIRQEEITIANLKQKTSLLENANCIDIENAHCKFLSDALEAKEQLNDRIDLSTHPVVQAYTNSVMKLDQSEKLLETFESDNSISLQDTFDYQHRTNVINMLLAKKESFSGKEELLNSYNSQLESERKNNKTLIISAKEFMTKGQELKARYEPFRNLGDEVDRLEEAKAKLIEIETAEIKAKELEFDNNNYNIKIIETEKLIAELSLGINQELTKISTEFDTVFTLVPDNIFNKIMELEQIQVYGRKEISEMTEENKLNRINLGGLKANLKQLDDKIVEFKEKTALREQIAILKANYYTLQESFSQDGVPFMIIRTMVDILQMNANETLGNMTDGKMSIEIVLDKPLRSNKNKEIATLEVYVNDYIKGRKPYLSLSGGESVRASLAFVLALTELKASQVGLKTGALFVDEPPFLDNQGVQDYCNVLDQLSLKHSDMTIIAISHDQEMKARFDQVIEVYKSEDEGSKIRIL